MPELILNRLSNFFFFLVIKKFTPEESSFKLQESSFLAKGWRDYLGPPDRNVNQPEVLFKSIAWDIIYFSIKKKKMQNRYFTSLFNLGWNWNVLFIENLRSTRHFTWSPWIEVSYGFIPPLRLRKAGGGQDVTQVPRLPSPATQSQVCLLFHLERLS